MFRSINSPVRMVMSHLDVLVNGRIRPISRSEAISVFRRIEVDVIEVIFKVSKVSNAVLPKSALPYPSVSPSSLWSSYRHSYPPFESQAAVNPSLILLILVEKSLSPGGSVQRQWKWSGSKTDAMFTNGDTSWTACHESRSISMALGFAKKWYLL